MLNFTYSVKSLSTGNATNASPLILALRHHLDILQSPTLVAVTENTIRGLASGVAERVWQMKEPLTNITF